MPRKAGKSGSAGGRRKRPCPGRDLAGGLPDSRSGSGGGRRVRSIGSHPTAYLVGRRVRQQGPGVAAQRTAGEGQCARLPDRGAQGHPLRHLRLGRQRRLRLRRRRPRHRVLRRQRHPHLVVQRGAKPLPHLDPPAHHRRLRWVQRLPAARLEGRARRPRRRDRPRRHRRALPMRHVEVEQGRAPAVLLHLHQLARPAADRLPGRHRDHRRHDYRHRAHRRSRPRRRHLPHRRQGNQGPAEGRTPCPTPVPRRVELHYPQRTNRRTTTNQADYHKADQLILWWPLSWHITTITGGVTDVHAAVMPADVRAGDVSAAATRAAAERASRSSRTESQLGNVVKVLASVAGRLAQPGEAHPAGEAPPGRRLCLAGPAGVTSASACLADGHVLRGEVGPRGPGHCVGGEVALQRAVGERVVQRCHDHGLVEHQVAVADRPGRRVDRVEEAVHAVDARILRPQRLDVRVGLLREHIQGEERRVRGDDVLGGAAVTLGQPQVRVVRSRAEARKVSPSTPNPPYPPLSSAVLDGDIPQTAACNCSVEYLIWTWALRRLASPKPSVRPATTPKSCLTRAAVSLARRFRSSRLRAVLSAAGPQDRRRASNPRSAGTAAARVHRAAWVRRGLRVAEERRPVPAGGRAPQHPGHRRDRRVTTCRAGRTGSRPARSRAYHRGSTSTTFLRPTTGTAAAAYRDSVDTSDLTARRTAGWPRGGPWPPAVLLVVLMAVQLAGSVVAGHGQPDRRSLDALAVALLIAGPATLWLRRRYPLPVLGAVVAVTLTYLLVGYPYGPVVRTLVVVLVQRSE